MQWSEEVLLLREEMCRVLLFLEWHAGWWDSRGQLHTGLQPEYMEGVAAYAAKQAHICQAIRLSFDLLWRTSWRQISEGAGANNEVLDLGLAISTITLYPSSGDMQP